MGFPGGSVVKHLPAMQETQEIWVRSLGWEVPLEEGMVSHSSVLAWRIPWTEEPDGLQSMGSQRVRHDWKNLACTHIQYSMVWIQPNFLFDSITTRHLKRVLSSFHFINSLAINILTQSSLASAGNWFQHLLWIPKSTDAQAPYVKWHIVSAYKLYTSAFIYFKSSLDYL